MYLRNIRANEDVMPSVPHRASPSVHHHKIVETWQMVSFKTHACGRDPLLGFLFLAFIGVTFIMAPQLVMGYILTPFAEIPFSWIYYFVTVSFKMGQGVLSIGNIFLDHFITCTCSKYHIWDLYKNMSNVQLPERIQYRLQPTVDDNFLGVFTVSILSESIKYYLLLIVLF